MNTLRSIIRNDHAIKREDYFALFSQALEDRKHKSTLIALLAALSSKPLNLADVINFVEYIEQDSPKQSLSVPDNIVNIVGTGGGISTFNISTTATFVAASAGAKVLKSGSYAYNSQCGSLDLLTNLGINLNLSNAGLEAMLNELNIGFVSPKMYPPLLKRIAVSILPLALKDIGGFINTIGPLLCPFQVQGQICGVRSYDQIELFAQALHRLEIPNSIAVWSDIGMDEFSALGINHFAMSHQSPKIQQLDPTHYGMSHTNIDELSGGSPAINEAIMKHILKGGNPLAARDTVALNAAQILILSGQSDSIQDATALALETIDNGAAYRLLQKAIEFSQDVSSSASN